MMTWHDHLALRYWRWRAARGGGWRAWQEVGRLEALEELACFNRRRMLSVGGWSGVRQLAMSAECAAHTLIANMQPVQAGALTQSLQRLDDSLSWRADCPGCEGGRIGPFVGACERCDGRGWVWRVATDDVLQASTCSSCGDALPDAARFCIACGCSVAVTGRTVRL
jgi:hypothetical protein